MPTMEEINRALETAFLEDNRLLGEKAEWDEVQTYWPPSQDDFQSLPDVHTADARILFRDKSITPSDPRRELVKNAGLALLYKTNEEEDFDF